MIAWWPGKIEADTLTETPGHIIDFMATFIDIGKATYPKKHNGEKILSLEGKSLMPIFEGNERHGHDYYAWEWSGNKAYREGDTKAVWDKITNEWELFDLSIDRTETNNLAETHPERLKQLTTSWYEWAKKTGAKTSAKKK